MKGNLSKRKGLLSSITQKELDIIAAAISEQKEDKKNKVTSLSKLSTDTQYPSAKSVYSLIEDLQIDSRNLQMKCDMLDNSKVDKVSGKGLSSNDFTDDEKGKLAGLPTSQELTSVFEQKINKVTAVNENSTDTQYPSALAVYYSSLGVEARINAKLSEYVHKGTDSTNDISTAEPATAYYPTAEAVRDYAEPKTTVVNQVPIIDGPHGPDPITFNLGINNRETRYILNPVYRLTISFPNGEYDTDYIEGISFKSDTPTYIKYAATGIIQWVGTDCFIAGDNKSIFKPSANMQYDIVFYYNGGNYIVGLVNGYKVTTGNQEANA